MSYELHLQFQIAVLARPQHNVADCSRGVARSEHLRRAEQQIQNRAG